MTFVTYAPIRGGEGARGGLSSLFDHALGAVDRTVAGTFSPPVDIVEETDSISILADLPGFDRDGIEVSIENRTLTLRGERRRGAASTEARFCRTERRHGSFERTFSLPSNVDSGRITADYTDGVLRVTVPKAAEARPRKIEVTTA